MALAGLAADTDWWDWRDIVHDAARLSQVMDAVRRELRSRPETGLKFIKALRNFCTRVREGAWALKCKSAVAAFSGLMDGLQGLVRQHRRGECVSLTNTLARTVSPFALA